ncbi:MAG: hypothetical protein U1U88_000909 [Lawsonella clevelandensis]
MEKKLAPYTMEDYYTYVDGRHRLDGVRDVLRSATSPKPRTWRQSNGWAAEEQRVHGDTAADGIRAYPGTVALIEVARLLGIPYAVVSSSRNTRPVLQAANLLDRFEVIVDGNTADEKHLTGKPAPDTYLYAAELSACPPASVRSSRTPPRVWPPAGPATLAWWSVSTVAVAQRICRPLVHTLLSMI